MAKCKLSVSEVAVSHASHNADVTFIISVTVYHACVNGLCTIMLSLSVLFRL